MAKTLAIYKRIEELQEKFLRLAKGKEALLKLISEAEIFEQVYNSNAIENSTLTLDETEKILLKIDLDRYISERELFEAKNLAYVVDYINKRAIEKQLDFDTILNLHKWLLSNIKDDIAGRFRQENEWVRVGNYIAIDPKLIEQKMNELLLEWQIRSKEHIVKRIALFHLTFEHIHPFVDGNGRIGRLLNNYQLIRENHVPINIKYTDRQKYYNAFQQFDSSRNTSIMEEIVGKALTNSYNKRLAYLEGMEIVSLSEYAKRTKQSHSNLLNKAKRQTNNAFMEKGKWKIGMD